MNKDYILVFDVYDTSDGGIIGRFENGFEARRFLNNSNSERTYAIKINPVMKDTQQPSMEEIIKERRENKIDELLNG